MRIPFFALVAVLVFLVCTLSPPGASALGAPGAESPTGQTISIPGDWLVTGSVSESHSTIVVDGGVTVAAGGILDLDSVTLEMNESGNLAQGVVVRSGGELIATNFTLLSSDPSFHTFLRESPGGALSINGGKLEDIGGNVGGEFGLTLGSPYTNITDVTFDHYYQAVHINGASHVTLSDLTVLNSTSGNSTFAIEVTGGSDNFHLRNSRFDIPQDVGAVDLNDPGAIVTGNTFNLDPQGTLIKPIDIGCSNSGLENASGTYFANNTVNGAGVVIEAASNVNITANRIENTGVNRPYGVLAGVPTQTAPGLWESGVDITHNYITNFSRYGIRLQLNVTNFHVSGNTIVNPSRNPGPAWTESFGGLQIDGIYVIRGISNGTIDHNYIDLSEPPYISSNAILLESKVTDVKVVDNQVYNMTQNGVMVQGNVPGFVTNAPSWELGPSSGNLIANNLFDSMRTVDDDNFTYKGILIWLWSNYTTVENNTFIGFQNVDASGTSVNGAAIVCTGSYNIFTNNTVLGARYAFAFTKYTSLPNEYVGESNRSDNLVYGNHLSGIAVAPVYETPSDGMGPLDNVIDVLSNASTSRAPPTSYLESISGADLLAASEQNGTYSQSLRTASPINGRTETYVSTSPSTMSSFNISVTGSFEDQYPTLALDSANGTSVQYQLSSSATVESHLVALAPTEGSYAANYSVQTVVGKNRSSFAVAGPDGPALFKTPVSAPIGVQVSLLDWQSTQPPPPPENNTTVGPTLWSIWGNLTLVNGTSPANVSVGLEFGLTNGSTNELELTTVEGGEFGASNLTFNGSLDSVALGPAPYSVRSVTVTQPVPQVLVVSIVGALLTTPIPKSTPHPHNISNPSAGRGQTRAPMVPTSLLGPRLAPTTLVTLGGVLFLVGALLAAVRSSRHRALAATPPERLHRFRRDPRP